MEKRNGVLLGGFAAATVALLVFAWLARQVLSGERFYFDGMVRDSVHAWATPALTGTMRVITQLGSPVTLIALTVFIIWRLALAGRRHAAVLLVIAGIGSEALDGLLKLLFHRQRPDPFFGYPLPDSFSFPSGHAISSVCFYGVIAAIVTARMKSPIASALMWAGALILAVLVGFSRIYLGVHYPSDVAAGFAAGIVWVAAVRWSYNVWLRRRAPGLTPS